MRICPKCNSCRIQAVEYVIRYHLCLDCGWMGISHAGQNLQLFRSRQLVRLLRRSSWIYLVFFLVILGGGYLISSMMSTPAKDFALKDELPLFPEKSVTAGEIKSKSVTTEAPVMSAPLPRATPVLPEASPAGAESVSLHPPEYSQVVANSDSKLYHLPGMKYYNKISSHHRVIFPSEEAARQAGYHKAPR